MVQTGVGVDAESEGFRVDIGWPATRWRQCCWLLGFQMDPGSTLWLVPWLNVLVSPGHFLHQDELSMPEGRRGDDR